MKQEMTSRERQEAYARGERVDRIPYSTGAGESILPYYGISDRDYLFSSEVTADVAFMCLRDFGGDGMGLSITARAFAEAAGSELEYPKQGYSHIVRHLIPDYRKFPAQLPEITVEKSGRLRTILDSLLLMQRRYGREYSVGYSVPCPGNCALGFMPGLGGTLYFCTPPENIRFFSECIQKYGRDSRKGETCQAALEAYESGTRR